MIWIGLYLFAETSFNQLDRISRASEHSKEVQLLGLLVLNGQSGLALLNSMSSREGQFLLFCVPCNIDGISYRIDEGHSFQFFRQEAV
jgi:hypothetical protein